MQGMKYMMVQKGKRMAGVCLSTLILPHENERLVPCGDKVVFLGSVNCDAPEPDHHLYLKTLLSYPHCYE
jgi:hypothetical protein